MKAAVATVVAGLALAGMPAGGTFAKVVQLKQSSWWVLHGGDEEDGVPVCALVTSPPNIPEARFVFQYRKGSRGIFIRLVKPSWNIPPGTVTRVGVQFGYRPGRVVDVEGRGTELRGFMPEAEAVAFLEDHASGRIDVSFSSGNEPPWELATGGFGFLLPDFGKCIQMLQPAEPSRPPTQPF